MLLDSDSDNVFNSQKLHLTRREIGKKHTIDYVDEIINPPLINVDKLIIKAPKLHIASGKMTMIEPREDLVKTPMIS